MVQNLPARVRVLVEQSPERVHIGHGEEPVDDEVVGFASLHSLVAFSGVADLLQGFRCDTIDVKTGWREFALVVNQLLEVVMLLLLLLLRLAISTPTCVALRGRTPLLHVGS